MMNFERYEEHALRYMHVVKLKLVISLVLYY